MKSTEDILAIAAARQQDMNLSYAGALTPPEAQAILRANAEATLIDVRTIPEFLYVGRIPNTANVEWQVFPDMNVNDKFCQAIEEHVNREQIALFICRSGVRSHHAAAIAAAAGWKQAYNILEGFEGDLDGNGHRNNINGWRFHGLPWIQS